RKTKKHKPSSSCLTSSNISSRFDLSAGPGSSEFKFMAPQTMAPAMEFQLGGLSLPRLHPATAGVYTQFIASSGAHHQPIALGSGTGGCFSLDLLGVGGGNYPTIPNSGNSSSSSSSLSLAGGGATGGDQSISISSIESLSSINQEMHWKLQQQRLAMIYGQTTVDEDGDHNNNNNHHQEKGISLFKNLEITRNNKIDVGGPNPTEWLFDQLQTNPTANYGDNHNNNNSSNDNNASMGATNNNDDDFNGVWTAAEAAELHHHHRHQQHHQFNGMQ
ncbi:hypothetical protein SOVF_215440, partial [Spinacia oleracea]